MRCSSTCKQYVYSRILSNTYDYFLLFCSLLSSRHFCKVFNVNDLELRKKIRLWLKKTGHSQSWLADQLNIRRNTVANYLSNKDRALPSVFVSLCADLMDLEHLSTPSAVRPVSTGEACALVPLRLSTDQFYSLESASRQSAMTLSSYVLACALWCSSRGLPPSSVLRDQLSDPSSGGDRDQPPS